MRGGGEAAHVQPDLGDDHLCVVFADAGDLVEPLDRGESRAFGQGVGSHADRVTGGWAVAAGVDGLGLGHRRQQLFDAGGERVDLGGERVDLVQQHPGEFGVVVVEAAAQRLDEGGALGLHPATGQAGEHLRIPLPGDQCLDHGAPGHAHDVGGHRRQLDQGVFEQFLQPLHLPGPVVGEIGPQPGVVAQSTDLGRGHERRP